SRMPPGSVIYEDVAAYRHLSREHIPGAATQVIAGHEIDLWHPARCKNDDVRLQRDDVVAIHIAVGAHSNAEPLDFCSAPVDDADQIAPPVHRPYSHLPSQLL